MSLNEQHSHNWFSRRTIGKAIGYTETRPATFPQQKYEIHTPLTPINGQAAGQSVNTVPATVREIADEAWKLTTKNGRVSAKVRGGGL